MGGAEVEDDDMMVKSAYELAGAAFPRVIDGCSLVGDVVRVEAGPMVAKMGGLSVNRLTGSCQIGADMKKERRLRRTARKVHLGIFLPEDLAVAVVVFAAREKPAPR